MHAAALQFLKDRRFGAVAAHELVRGRSGWPAARILLIDTTPIAGPDRLVVGLVSGVLAVEGR